MNKEKDFFKTCFNTVAGLEVKNESQAIAKEVILSEIEDLQQEHQQLKKDYDRIYNENCKLREEHNITDISLLDENYKLKDNWDELKEWVNKHYDYYMNNEDYIGGRLCFTDIKNKMQEIEGSDE